MAYLNPIQVFYFIFFGIISSRKNYLKRLDCAQPPPPFPQKILKPKTSSKTSIKRFEFDSPSSFLGNVQTQDLKMFLKKILWNFGFRFNPPLSHSPSGKNKNLRSFFVGAVRASGEYQSQCYLCLNHCYCME